MAGAEDNPDDHRRVLDDLEEATRGLLHLNVALLVHMEKSIGLAALRALQSLERHGPSLVTELGEDLDMLPSTASRLSDRLADADLITRRVSPTNRRATLLELTAGGVAVLEDLVARRGRALTEVAENMRPEDCDALLRGARAFTAARRALRTPENGDDRSTCGASTNR